MQAYCVTCKKKIEIKEGKKIHKAKTGMMTHAMNRVSGKCPHCGGKVSRIVK